MEGKKESKYTWKAAQYPNIGTSGCVALLLRSIQITLEDTEKQIDMYMCLCTYTVRLRQVKHIARMYCFYISYVGN